MIRSVCIVTLCLFAISYAEPSTNDGHVWVAGNLSIPFPSNAIHAGYMTDGTNIYVGRYNITGLGVLPAAIVVENGTAFIGHDWNGVSGTEYVYDILIDEGDFEYSWIRSYDGIYEEGSVSVGTLRNSDQSFICRAWLNGALRLGNKFGTSKLCYLFYYRAYATKNVDKYEILVARSKRKC